MVERRILINYEVFYSILDKPEKECSEIFLPRHIILPYDIVPHNQKSDDMSIYVSYEIARELEFVNILYASWKNDKEYCPRQISLTTHGKYTRPIYDRSKGMAKLLGLKNIYRAFKQMVEISESNDAAAKLINKINIYSYPLLPRNSFPQELIREIALFILDDIVLHEACTKTFCQGSVEIMLNLSKEYDVILRASFKIYNR